MPIVGIPADGLNAVIYYAEGDYVNGTISVVGMVPGLGEAAIGAKLAGKAVKTEKAIAKGNNAIKAVEHIPGANHMASGAMSKAGDAKKLTGEYGSIGGHHVHPQSSFKDNINYNKDKARAALEDKMSKEMHDKATQKQRSRYTEMKDKLEEGVHPTKKDFDDAALKTLKDGGVSTKDAKQMVKESREHLDAAGLAETNIPWGPKLHLPPQ